MRYSSKTKQKHEREEIFLKKHVEQMEKRACVL